jgi:hypothetical protein
MFSYNTIKIAVVILGGFLWWWGRVFSVRYESNLHTVQKINRNFRSRYLNNKQTYRHGQLIKQISVAVAESQIISYYMIRYIWYDMIWYIWWYITCDILRYIWYMRHIPWHLPYNWGKTRRSLKRTMCLGRWLVPSGQYGIPTRRHIPRYRTAVTSSHVKSSRFHLERLEKTRYGRRA